MIVKGMRMAGTHGMPEGAELVLGGWELEVDAVLPPEHFRCSSCSCTSQEIMHGKYRISVPQLLTKATCIGTP